MEGIGRSCKQLLGLRSSAPASVCLNIFFIWCVYILVIRPAISPFIDIFFNAGIIALLIGLYRIVSSDPGFISSGSVSLGMISDDDFLKLSEKRVRYCKRCERNVMAFDHHCPAFGNCIGQKNHALFIVLIAGFIVTEALYIVCSYQVASSRGLEITGRETSWGVLAASTMYFSVLQVLWQVVFLMWHIYCVCFNILTDEWINWKRYPEFHRNIAHPEPGEPVFVNPYDKGILRNLKEFLQGNG